MKVALLLSGLARKVEEGYKTTWGHVIDNYDTDVYLHAWKDEEWEKVPPDASINYKQYLYGIDGNAP